MQVISASRRTDIPAFYWPWFRRRLEAGFCHCVNPFNYAQIHRVSLQPRDVAAIVFWTRNAAPMLADLADLESAGYTYYVQYTITGYPRELEPACPPQGQAVDHLRRLSDRIGPHRIVWRYDPIVLSSLTPPAYHREQFAALAQLLAGAVETVHLSYCDAYARTQRRFAQLTRATGITFAVGSDAVRRGLAGDLAGIAASRGLHLRSCAEPELHVPGIEPAAQALGVQPDSGDDHSSQAAGSQPGGGDDPRGHVAGIQPGSCVDPVLLARLRPDLRFHLEQTPTRAGCRCVQSVDIGAFDTCPCGCAYCYASSSKQAPQQRRAQHDPEDSLLWRPPSLKTVDLEAPGAARARPPAPIERVDDLPPLDVT